MPGRPLGRLGGRPAAPVSAARTEASYRTARHDARERAGHGEPAPLARERDHEADQRGAEALRQVEEDRERAHGVGALLLGRRGHHRREQGRVQQRHADAEADGRQLDRRDRAPGGQQPDAAGDGHSAMADPFCHPSRSGSRGRRDPDQQHEAGVEAQEDRGPSRGPPMSSA